MKNFRKGVSFFTKATATVGVTFPEDDVCCYRCPFMTTQYGSKREECSLTHELLVAPQSMIGYECPLSFVKEDNDG